MTANLSSTSTGIMVLRGTPPQPSDVQNRASLPAELKGKLLPAAPAKNTPSATKFTIPLVPRFLIQDPLPGELSGKGAATFSVLAAKMELLEKNVFVDSSGKPITKEDVKQFCKLQAVRVFGNSLLLRSARHLMATYLISRFNSETKKRLDLSSTTLKPTELNKLADKISSRKNTFGKPPLVEVAVVKEVSLTTEQHERAVDAANIQMKRLAQAHTKYQNHLKQWEKFRLEASSDAPNFLTGSELSIIGQLERSERCIAKVSEVSHGLRLDKSISLELAPTAGRIIRNTEFNGLFDIEDTNVSEKADLENLLAS